ncbi:MAG: hypothetical protein HUK40_05015 [Desulfobacter sp.]|nr:hypothetical protein [Desulfobacter sp.]WDP87416.1 MAG: hypothetical protein HUN05_21700 [Desulfobacter sp.]
MFAKTADELREMMRQNPSTSPSTFLMDDSFAAFCYDNRDGVWLKAAFNRDADPEDCRKWGLSASDWRTNVEMAGLALEGPSFS